MKFILGLKIGMSQMFDEKGNIVPVTLIEAGPCTVTQVKTDDKDGYKAIQCGFVTKKKPKMPEKGKEFRYLKEERTSGDDQLKEGDKIDISIFKTGDSVKISGISKGKGFAGVVKKWGFKGRASVSHGTKHELRTPGSTGCSIPERVIKGKKMAGRMGFERVSLKNLEIAKVDLENNLLVIKGAVPGRRGTLLEIKG